MRKPLPLHVLLLIVALLSARLLLAAHDVQHGVAPATADLCQICATASGPAGPTPAQRLPLLAPLPAAVPTDGTVILAQHAPLRLYRSRAPPAVLV